MSNLGKYELNSIVTGDCLSILRRIRDGVFQACITSPPYWGLRSYNTPPQVWGGDPDCEHEWETGIRKGMTGGPTDIAYPGGKGVDQRGNKRIQPDSQYAFCRRCNAWRGSLGLEPTPELYVAHLVEVFREVKRTLRDDGTLWLNLGDSYASSSFAARPNGKGDGITGDKAHFDIPRPTVPCGLKPKDLVGIPWRVAFALQADGWWLRSDIIWHKSNCMPESVRDRPTKSHEYVFLLSKSKSYHYDADAIREPVKQSTVERYANPTYGNGHKLGYGESARISRINPIIDCPGHKDTLIAQGRNKRTIWTIPTQSFKEAHFATFPEKLVEPCVKAGTSAKGACPECGKAWTRVTKKEFVPQQDVSAEKGVRGHSDTKKQPFDSWDGFPRGTTHSNTIDWQPTCSCNAGDPIPQVVCDIFMGAGTTAVVAKQLGRSYFGIELNEEYCEMARERIARTQPPLFTI